MSRSNRMFEIIQMLRSANKPLTAEVIAGLLEVTKRTVYRDIAALQAMRMPIEGEAGVGYIMRPGFDLPPLMFTSEEIEAVVVGLALLRRTGDTGLQAAAERVGNKISDVLPDEAEYDLDQPPLYVSGWTAIPTAQIDLRLLRRAIRDEEKLHITYSDGRARMTERTIKPLAVIYYIDVVVLAAWCELRNDFRHFRVDRIADFALTGQRYQGEGDRLRIDWREQHQLP